MDENVSEISILINKLENNYDFIRHRIESDVEEEIASLLALREPLHKPSVRPSFTHDECPSQEARKQVYQEINQLVLPKMIRNRKRARHSLE